MPGSTDSRRLVLARWRRLLAAALTTAAVALSGVLAADVPASADVPSSSPATVAAALGASKVPAAIVVLVDISLSMSGSQGGLYPQVQQDLPKFLGALARQDPQDRVAVIVFGTPGDTRTVYPLGPPTSSIPLPGDATSDGTDIGYAFKQALDNLSLVSPDIAVGGVLLLSDGGINAPTDLTYDGGLGYDAPGWAALRTKVRGLGIPVTGFGLPLTTNQSDIGGLDAALAAAFGSQRQMLTSNFTDLSSQLALAQQQILAKRVASAAAPDIGRGVRVTWHGGPGTGGKLGLDLSAGHADAAVTLTSTTDRVPLDVTSFSVESTGFPVSVTGTIPAADQALAPGRSVTLPVHLSWQPVKGESSLIGGSQSVAGRLTLNARVYSPFTNAIRNAYGDSAFTVGSLADGASAQFPAMVPKSVSSLDWLLIVMIAAAIATGIAAFRARLAGSLTLTSVDGDTGTLLLPSRPWLSMPTDDLIGIQGRMTVRGMPFAGRMRVRLRLSQRPAGERVLAPGGRTMIAGIDVVHDDASASRGDAVPGRR